MNILDPRFRYTPAAATNVTVTWERFGFSAQDNAQQRADQIQRLFGAGDSFAETVALRELYLRVAAAGMSA
jgi:hypothetical protein